MSDGGEEVPGLTTADSKRKKLQQKQVVSLADDNLIKMYTFLEQMSGGLDP
jgi:hypothetical protein